MRTAVPAVILALVASVLAALLPALSVNLPASWSDLYSAAFGITLLAAWPLGTFIFTSRRHRT